MKKLICIGSLAAVFLIAISSWTDAQPQPLQPKPIQAPAQLSPQTPMTPERLKAILPKLERKVYIAPTQRLPVSYGQKVLIVLQENTGRLSSLPEDTPEQIKAMIAVVVDALAETFEDLKTTLQANGKYNKVVLLTDLNCTRAKLLENLVLYTKQGWTIDLLIMGHGSSNSLELYGGQHLTAQNIQSLKTEAQAQGCTKLNLRLVYMCNCFGSTTNDDWIAAGALHSIGPLGKNALHEPQITFFMNNWVGGQTPGAAATNAYNATIPFYLLIFPPQPVTRWEKRPVQVPCGLRWDPTCVVAGLPTGCVRTVYCTAYIDFPVVTWQQNERIVSSQPVTLVNPAIAGQQWTFNTLIR